MNALTRISSRLTAGLRVACGHDLHVEFRVSDDANSGNVGLQ